MCLPPFEHIISVGKDVLVAVAAVVGAVVAVRGLSTWNRQLRGSAEYDLAKRVLKVTYRLRDAIQGVRHPVMWAAEMPAPPEAEAVKMSREERTHYGSSLAYQARWQKVVEARTDLQAELLEGEVLWGAELGRRFDALNKLQHELLVAVRSALTLMDPKAPEARKNVTQKRQEKVRDIMFDESGDEGDEFTKDLGLAMAPIEEYLKPHLRK